MRSRASHRLSSPPRLPERRTSSRRLRCSCSPTGTGSRRHSTTLVGNAIPYAPGGAVELRLSLEQDEAGLTVRDDGIGIPADELDRLFDRFFRASTARNGGFPGSGIGLSVVQRIVETHGGTLDVEGAVGDGRTFRRRLPARS